ncbi:MmgE/PrpD family protein [Pseudarthrobacter sp. efr-133-R2A-89]|uniref:MmgE/PrpD family protein n=1 Tax=Pseudarthrobacter sp. efr-133-R2A-89 TaxID=3040302 RepID=UPI002555F671|nr:MmgE/PrpD family protein [Pseudarthrobacter sp. efr-133-R2A-89]
MSPELTASERIADFLTALRPADIPPEVLHRAKLHLLDTLGAGIAGAASREVHLSRSALAAAHGTPSPGTGSPVWGTPAGLPPLAAAFVNGVACHAFELDDSGGCDHSGAVVVPAALAALAVRAGGSAGGADDGGTGVDGGRLLHAVVSGYEVGRRVQDALGGYDPVNNQGWHSTGVTGTFAAAVAAGVVLGMDAPQLVSAIGLAGSFTGGTWAFIGDGAMSKRMHVGRAAEAGLNSALLAKAGFTGPRDLFSAPWGSFLKLYGQPGDVQESRLFDTLGEDWQVQRASIKPYATCRSTHSAIDAILELRDRGITAEATQKITVRTSALIADMCGTADVRSLVSTQLSMQFALAAALMHGTVGLDQVAEQGRNDPRLRELMGRIHVEVDPEQHGGSAEPFLTVQTDTDSFGVQAVKAKGAATNRLSDQETIGKFEGLAGTRLPGDRVKAISRLVLGLESAADAGLLLGLLAADSEPAVLT